MTIDGCKMLLAREQKAIELVARGRKAKTSIVKGGRNSKIIRLKTEDNELDIAIKFYRMQELEEIDRQGRERRFIEIAKKTKAGDCVPSIFMEKENDWTAFYWIEGTEMKTIEKADIKSITGFIEDINQRINEKECGQYREQNAIDALTNIEGLTDNIKRRAIEITESPEVAGKKGVQKLDDKTSNPRRHAKGKEAKGRQNELQLFQRHESMPDIVTFRCRNT